MPSVMITEVEEHIPVPVDQTKKKTSDDQVVVAGGDKLDSSSGGKQKQEEWVSSNPITLKRVQEICVKNGFYRTPSCNDKLYLHHKGWDKIADLEQYTECKVLWLEGNCIGKIEGLDAMRQTLRSLYLHENMLTGVDGVNIFENLDSLNVSDNHISSLNGFLANAVVVAPSSSNTTTAAAAASTTTFVTEAFCEEKQAEENAAAAQSAVDQTTAANGGGKLFQTLNTLQIKNNNLRHIEDIQVLCDFTNMSVLDLTGNKLEDGEGVLNVLEKMPNLKSLKLSGNPCVRKITMYRRTVLSRCVGLMHLDDRPVFEDERRTVSAWTAGGTEGEKAERQKIKQEAEDKVTKRLSDFKQLVRDAGATQEQLDGGVGVGSDDNDDEDSSSSSSSSSSSDDETKETEVKAEVEAAAEMTVLIGEDEREPVVEAAKTTVTQKHIDPEVQASRETSEEAAQLIEREVEVVPAALPSPKLQPNANSKYAKIWEMATKVSDAKEAAEQKQDHAADGPVTDDDEDEGDAWTPE